MQRSYTKNYIRIYFWQILSIVLNLLSLFIVIPRLSSQPHIYGIYSICISALIFLSYADLGFMNAGYKYASECYAREDKEKVIEIIGFVSFILLVFILIFAVVILTFAYHPDWLIKNIYADNDIAIARNLLLVLAIFSPNVVLQRMLQIIFGIRLEDYIFQRTLVVISICKIISVVFFVKNGYYNIVGYFLFCQAATTVGLVSALFYASRKYAIPLKDIVLNLKFSHKVYSTVKTLAFSSLFVTISWILFYEFDPYVIAKFSGSEAIAYYSIGLTCLSFFRSLFGTLFGPFTARFNHFIAVDDEAGLKNISRNVMSLLLPAVVFPVLSTVFLSKPFVFAWVGDKFSESVPVVTLLALCNLLAFLAYPSSILLIAKKKIRLLYYTSGIQLIIFWIGILLTFPYLGYISFAYFKLTCFIIIGITYMFFICDFLKMRLSDFLRAVIAPAILPVIAMIIFLLLVRGSLPLHKGKLYLMEVIGTGIAATLIGIGLYYFTSGVFRNYTKQILLQFRR